MAEVNLTIEIRVSDELWMLIGDFRRLIEVFPDRVSKFKIKFNDLSDITVFETKADEHGAKFFLIVPDPEFASFVTALKASEAAL